MLIGPNIALDILWWQVNVHVNLAATEWLTAVSLVPADDGGLGGDYNEEGHASRHAHNGADVSLKGVNEVLH